MGEFIKSALTLVILHFIWRTFFARYLAQQKGCTNGSFATSRPATEWPAFLRYKKVLHKHFDWRHLYAMLGSSRHRMEKK